MYMCLPCVHTTSYNVMCCIYITDDYMYICMPCTNIATCQHYNPMVLYAYAYICIIIILITSTV